MIYTLTITKTVTSEIEIEAACEEEARELAENELMFEDAHLENNVTDEDVTRELSDENNIVIESW